jgi:uncharacterized protein
MNHELLLLLAAAVFVVAILYSSVGHAGASGYIAVMSLLGLSAMVIKPTALALNVLVASIASWQFYQAGHFNWRLFWPFALLAVPMAYVGGAIQLPTAAFNLLLGVVLLYSAARFFVADPQERAPQPPRLAAALLVGAVLGLLSGLTGTGGGIFLTPLMLLMGWARAKEAAAVSALFILLNSSAGLLGNLASTRHWPDAIGWLLLAAAAGGAIGARLGSRRFAPLLIKRLLAAVLLIAGLKLLLT